VLWLPPPKIDKNQKYIDNEMLDAKHLLHILDSDNNDTYFVGNSTLGEKSKYKLVTNQWMTHALFESYLDIPRAVNPWVYSYDPLISEAKATITDLKFSYQISFGIKENHRIVELARYELIWPEIHYIDKQHHPELYKR